MKLFFAFFAGLLLGIVMAIVSIALVYINPQEDL